MWNLLVTKNNMRGKSQLLIDTVLSKIIHLHGGVAALKRLK